MIWIQKNKKGRQDNIKYNVDRVGWRTNSASKLNDPDEVSNISQNKQAYQKPNKCLAFLNPLFELLHDINIQGYIKELTSQLLSMTIYHKYCREHVAYFTREPQDH